MSSTHRRRRSRGKPGGLALAAILWILPLTCPASPALLASGEGRRQPVPIAATGGRTQEERDASLRAAWEGMKDALRRGDIPAALTFIHSSVRNRDEAALRRMTPVQLAAIDQHLPPVRLVEMGPNGAEYEMRRVRGEETLSFPVWFQMDMDGVWRISSVQRISRSGNTTSMARAECSPRPEDGRTTRLFPETTCTEGGLVVRGAASRESWVAEGIIKRSGKDGPHEHL